MILNLINVGPFHKAFGPGKNPKLIKVGSTLHVKLLYSPSFREAGHYAADRRKGPSIKDVGNAMERGGVPKLGLKFATS